MLRKTVIRQFLVEVTHGEQMSIPGVDFTYILNEALHAQIPKAQKDTND